MANLLWVGGGGDNLASNPDNWVDSNSGLHAAPQPGDNLGVQSNETLSVQPNITISVVDGALAGDQLGILGSYPWFGSATLNLSGHAAVNLATSYMQIVANLSGNDTLEASIHGSERFAGASDFAANLAPRTHMHGSFSIGESVHLTISGGQNTRYIHYGTDTLTGGTEVVGTKVVGSGTFILTDSDFLGAAIPSRLEFARFAAVGQKVDVTGGSGLSGTQPSTVQLDNPAQFHGTVDLHDLSLVDLVGLAHADTWHYANDLLCIRNACGKVINTLHVVSDASSTGGVHGLSLSKTTAGDVLVSPGTDFSGSIGLQTT